MYITKDIYLAATLSSLGYILLEITQEGTTFFFHFDNSTTLPNSSIPEVEFEAEQYWINNLLADPKKLFESFKNIKARMYDQKRRGENG